MQGNTAFAPCLSPQILFWCTSSQSRYLHTMCLKSWVTRKQLFRAWFCWNRKLSQRIQWCTISCMSFYPSNLYTLSACSRLLTPFLNPQREVCLLWTLETLELSYVICKRICFRLIKMQNRKAQSNFQDANGCRSVHISTSQTADKSDTARH